MTGGVPPTTLPMHGTTRYPHVHIKVSGGLMKWRLPRTLLGLVPIGEQRVEIPIAEVENARMRHAVHPIRMLIGLALAVAPWFFLPWWGLNGIRSFGPDRLG